MLRYLLNTLTGLLLSVNVVAQINFISVPEDLHFFPREKDNYGHFQIIGTSDHTTVLRTEIVKRQGAEIMESFSISLNAGDSFSIAHKIPAVLNEFNLNIYEKRNNQNEQLIHAVKYLVAGDFYIVSGQSNAECGGDFSNNTFDSTYSHPCNRSIGANFNWATGLSKHDTSNYTIDQDCHFGRPSAIYWANGLHAFTGLWPLKLQYNMAIESGVPHCFINGAVGSTRISYHQASHTPSLPDSLIHSTDTLKGIRALPYDRLYKKLYSNHATMGVKGVFWYQGEGDGNSTIDTALNYPNQFKRLRNSWLTDYPNIKKIIVLQINVGCAGNYLDRIREIQRKFPENYSDVVVMSTVGSTEEERRNDNCHYTEKGYSKIADNLLGPVRKYFLDQDLADELILPANPEKIYYSSLNQICIEFNKKIVIQEKTQYQHEPTGTAYLKDYFYNEDGIPITILSLENNGNKLYLNLDPLIKRIKSITYLPLMFTNIPSGYSGPWILNADDPKIGAYSFYKYPVDMVESSVFPNPTSDYVKIYLPGDHNFSVNLYNQFGQLLSNSSNNNEYEVLDLNTFSEGVYFLKIASENNNFTTKLIIKK